MMDDVVLATFPLREQRGPIRSTFMVVALGVLGACVGFVAATVALMPWLELLAFLGGAVGAIAGGALAAWLGQRARRTVTPPPVEVTASRVRMPRGARTLKTVDIPLTQVRSIEGRGAKNAPLLVIGTEQGFFALPMRAFADENGPGLLRAAVRTAIGVLPGGAQQLAEMDRREEDGRIVVRKRPRATQVLLGVIAGLFVFELTAGSPDDVVFMVRWGANAPALVAQGEWWRLFVAGLLHLSFLHFFLNATALWSLGVVVEKLVGTPRFVVVALGASVCGNVASALRGSHVFSVGASSLVFGLMGALLVVNLRFGRALPAGFLLGARRWVYLLGLNGFISLLPGVDLAAHAGGLVGGALLCLALVPRVTLDDRPARPIDVGLAAATCAAFVLAFALAGRAALSMDERAAGRALAFASLSSNALAPETINDLAWAVATDASADRALLDVAERAQRAALRTQPDNGAWLDTLAAVRRRQGALDDAIASSRRACLRAQRAEPCSLLARMLQERTSVDNRARLYLDGDEVVVDVDADLPGAVIYARARDVDTKAVSGLLRVVLPAGSTQARLPRPAELPARQLLKAYLVDTSGPELMPVRAAPIAFMPHDARVDALP